MCLNITDRRVCQLTLRLYRMCGKEVSFIVDLCASEFGKVS